MSFEDFLSSRQPPIRISSAGEGSARQQLPPLQSANECARLQDCDWVWERAEAVAALACRKDVKSVIMPTDNKRFSMCEHVESVWVFISVLRQRFPAASDALQRASLSTCSESAWTPLTRLFRRFPIFNQYLLHSHAFSASSAVRHLSPNSGASLPAVKGRHLNPLLRRAAHPFSLPFASSVLYHVPFCELRVLMPPWLTSLFATNWGEKLHYHSSSI